METENRLLKQEVKRLKRELSECKDDLSSQLSINRDLKYIKFFMYMTYFLCLIIICMIIATNV